MAAVIAAGSVCDVAVVGMAVGGGVRSSGGTSTTLPQY